MPPILKIFTGKAALNADLAASMVERAPTTLALTKALLPLSEGFSKVTPALGGQFQSQLARFWAAVKKDDLVSAQQIQTELAKTIRSADLEWSHITATVREFGLQQNTRRFSENPKAYDVFKKYFTPRDLLEVSTRAVLHQEKTAWDDLAQIASSKSPMANAALLILENQEALARMAKTTNALQLKKIETAMRNQYQHSLALRLIDERLSMDHLPRLVKDFENGVEPLLQLLSKTLPTTDPSAFDLKTLTPELVQSFTSKEKVLLFRQLTQAIHTLCERFYAETQNLTPGDVQGLKLQLDSFRKEQERLDSLFPKQAITTLERLGSALSSSIGQVTSVLAMRTSIALSQLAEETPWQEALATIPTPKKPHVVKLVENNGYQVRWDQREISTRLVRWLRIRASGETWENNAWVLSYPKQYSAVEFDDNLFEHSSWPPNLANDIVVRTIFEELGWHLKVEETSNHLVVRISFVSDIEKPAAAMTAASLFPTFEAFIKRGYRGYNNFHSYFMRHPKTYGPNMKREKPVFLRFQKEHPDLEQKLSDFWTEWRFEKPDPKAWTRKPHAPIEADLYEAYKIMASYTDLLPPDDPHYLTR